ncbi:25886_t:CDS:2, partial [Racocetra persica]
NRLGGFVALKMRILCQQVKLDIQYNLLYKDIEVDLLSLKIPPYFNYIWDISFVMIEDRLTDLFELFIKNLENFSNEIDDEDEQSEIYNREIRDDWIILAKISSNTIVDSSSGLGLSYAD